MVYALSHEFRPKDIMSGPSWTKAVSEQLGLELTLMLEKSEYSLGEPVNVTLTVTNIGNETLSFREAPSWWDFLVYNDTNDVLFRWRMGQISPMILREVPLDPGIGLTNKALVWPQTCNKTVSSNGIPDFPVSPGIYYIVGRYNYNPLGPSSNYNLETTPVQVIIT